MHDLSAFKVFGLSHCVSPYFSISDKLTHTNIQFVCLFGPNVNSIFRLELHHCKFDVCVTVLFAVANLVNFWTAFAVPVVFEFRLPCFKMSLDCWHFLWCQFIFDILLTFSALLYVFMVFCHCQELTAIGVKSATTTTTITSNTTIIITTNTNIINNNYYYFYCIDFG